jgi:hypothetical protein
VATLPWPTVAKSNAVLFQRSAAGNCSQLTDIDARATVSGCCQPRAIGVKSNTTELRSVKNAAHAIESSVGRTVLATPRRDSRRQDRR